jgi:predicted aspartyl protease
LSAFSVASISVEESRLSGEHFVVPITVAIDGKSIVTSALIDCGASGIAFIDQAFVSKFSIPTSKLNTPRILDVIDGRPVSSGAVTDLACLSATVGDHVENLPLFVTKLKYPIVLGIPWLRMHDVTVNFGSYIITFNSNYCRKHCGKPKSPVTGLCALPPPAEGPIEFNIDDSRADAAIPKPTKVSLIGAGAFAHLLKKHKLKAHALSIYEVNLAINQFRTKEEWQSMVPAEYHEFIDLFSEKAAEKLPPHRPYDHSIPLVEGKTPPYGPLYGMSRVELEALKKYLEENLNKSFIRHSSSPAGAPVLFVKKSDGSLRLCVDYRGLNEITVKNRYPLPLIQETLTRLSKAKWFTKLDLRGAYNLVRIAEGEEWKTAFRTRYGHFEYNVMPFGLTNAPASFQHFINDTLRDFLDVFCTAYLDDILIYSDSLAEHQIHVRQVLERLQQAGLYLKPEKCEFHVQEVKYLGLIITTEGIRMDPAKVAAVKDWQVPANLKDVQAFLGFANFYRRFILGYSKIVAPLTALTKKDQRFQWNVLAQAAFDELKEAFCSAPILAHFDPDRECVVETDASDYVSAGILSQYDDNAILHPVAYFSKKHSPAECNYEIYDKELMAIVRAFEEWRPHLESAKGIIEVLSDHKNLEYFTTTKLLNRRQARWSEFLSRFNFKIKYRPGKAGGKPDALTRRSGDLPKGGDERLKFQNQVVLKPENLDLSATSVKEDRSEVEGLRVKELLQKAYDEDDLVRDIMKAVKTGQRRHAKIPLAECEIQDDMLYRSGRLYIPKNDELRLQLIKDHHDSRAAGHPGVAKTLEMMSRQYTWPEQRKDIERYVRNCQICRRSKPTRHTPYGTLKPLEIPDQPWQHLTMDFVTGLPEDSGFNAILMVVDRLTKMRHLIPCRDTCTAEELALLYLNFVFRYHGLPQSVVSDRGPQFTSEFWKALCELLGIQVHLSTAYHPQTDGQSERMNAIMEQYLRAYVDYQQDNWVALLATCEFAANNHFSESLKTSPFLANYGWHPRFVETLAPLRKSRPNGPALDFAHQLAELHSVLRTELGLAQNRQAEYADASRSPAPRYLPGDQVWLSSKHFRTERPCRKLDHKFLGPFEVVGSVGTHAYRLKFPKSIKRHPVVHVSEIEPASNDPLPGQVHAPPPPVVIDGEEEWEVEEVVDSRRRYRKLEYKVKWVGDEEATWQPAGDLEHAADMVELFHQKYPNKPRAEKG